MIYGDSFSISKKTTKWLKIKIKEDNYKGFIQNRKFSDFLKPTHKIVSLKESGSNFIGKAKILESTPMGKIASSLLGEGVKLGVSSRGIGSLKPTKEGFNVVGEDFMLATAADIVADPSAPDAFVEGIMEGKEWIWEGSILREKKAEEIKNTIDVLAGRKELEEHKLNLFNDFLNSL